MANEGQFPKVAGDKAYASEYNAFYRSGLGITNINLIGSDLVNNPNTLNIVNSGTGFAIYVNQVGTTPNISGAVYIDNLFNSGAGLTVVSRTGSPNGATNLVHIETTNANWNRPLLRINDASTGGGAANIRMDSPNPDIEFVETDQTSPSGKFEIAVNSNVFQVNSRNDADSSFEPIFTIHQYRQGGAVGIGTQFDHPNAQLEIIPLSGKDIFMVSNAVGGNSGDILALKSGGALSINQKSPDASAKFQVDSTTQGVLLPRMTTAQLQAIAAPPVGLIVFNTGSNRLALYDGATWRNITAT